MSSEEKVLRFDPGGFILKIIFSVGMTVFLARMIVGKYGFFEAAMMCVCLYLMLYFIASLFGFSLRATGNYIVAVIVFLVLAALLGWGLSYVSALGKGWSAIVTAVSIAVLIWLPVNDIRKAILYYKETA